ncbi:MAG: penicillin-binding protein 2 [Magnetococcales bacterium]|nr:penicillin-binding protein 2 [Magnetococcales bacterium]
MSIFNSNKSKKSGATRSKPKKIVNKKKPAQNRAIKKRSNPIKLNPAKLLAPLLAIGSGLKNIFSKSEKKPISKRVTIQPQGKKPEVLGNPALRLEILLGLFMLAFVILAFRAFDLTILQGDALQRRAQNQHKKKITIPANRGRLIDRNGKTIAISMPMKSLSVDMDLVENPTSLARKLAPLIGKDRKQLIRKLKQARKGSYPVLKRQLPPDAIRKIRMLNHPALFFKPQSKRFYTMGEVTSHVLGFTNYQGIGVEGMERAKEEDLQGQPGAHIITRDRLGRLMPKVQLMTPAKPGTDIVLSIDTTIQYIAYRALLKGVTKSKAKSGFAIVMDPNNGEVLAMVNQPSFNPNDLANSSDQGRRNRAVADLFEPGSTFKIFTVAAGLDTDTVSPETVIDIEGGKFRVGDRTIQDFHKGAQRLTVEQILQKSSNVGAAKIGLKVGNEAMEGYLYQFGFGEPSGIELGHEPTGSIPDITFYKQVGLANRSYGYGVTATPLQLASATSAAINGGLLFTPKLVLGRYENGKFVPSTQKDPKRVISNDTSAKLRKILETVVGPEGTAPKAAVDGYRVAGKTGTARKAIPGKGYVKGYYYASFVGFIPSDKPDLVIFVGIDEPQGLYYGGLVAAPIFKEIAQGILPLLSIFPTKRSELQLPEMIIEPLAAKDTPLEVSLMGVSLDNAMSQLAKHKIVPEVHGSGLVTKFENSGRGPAKLFLK